MLLIILFFAQCEYDLIRTNHSRTSRGVQKSTATPPPPLKKKKEKKMYIGGVLNRLVQFNVIRRYVKTNSSPYYS